MIRDRLAVERTRLANERTLLAYVRTALSLLAAAAVLLHFFPDRQDLVLLAWGLGVLGVIVLLLGGWRFQVVRKALVRESQD